MLIFGKKMKGYFTDQTNVIATESRTSSPVRIPRERDTYIQITNTSDSTITIHVQVFQNDRNCDELNFNDELTANDTVVYDMDNIVKNNGSEVPINLQNDSFGYVVVSIGDGSEILRRGEAIIGNFRIVDEDFAAPVRTTRR